ncbi:MAG: DUF2179 domain-containing protein [Candidatus Marinimicrobia bacterium]|jgi:uncharacterized protein YebE (UPF0316 family)|nr:DUF2179 domain-containing protein [Candidatus Neomarinimicrobiota bacterium]MCK9560308.1 DUF2179 domain-containing protein [Candidatus Neomarinimicrobiota bacterium]MDD5061665.1 DUF2179 domain-containing protein [Candidatus Neomarinimicrobiota bacterium]MDD5540298.1 DUF2179 domain-containing protein [Candidatus Neomarinimicrobiota bacterium]
METSFFDTSFYQWVVIPFLIFIARITDVSIGTIRIIQVSKGNKLIASVLGFFEVSIWLLAISQVMQQGLNNFASFFAYGLGFASGNYIGIIIEEKLALGLQAIRIISPETVDVLTMTLRDEGFGVTVIDAKGAKGQVHIIYSIVQRKNVNEVIRIAREISPDVFISIQDIRSVNAGFFSEKSQSFKWRRWNKKK